MALLTIVKYPHEILKKKAQPVTAFGHSLAVLAGDMIETMHENDGVGLAAPQVGETMRLFVAAPQARKSSVVYVFVNPLVQVKGNAFELGSEGCLSLPGVYDDVERSKSVTVTYQDVEGRMHTLEADGFLARIIQHENDHLEGTVFIDRLGHSSRKKVLDEYRRLQHIVL